MNDSYSECVFYNPPGSSHTEHDNGHYPDVENINLGLFIKGRKVGGNKYANDFLVPGMTGFDEARALIQLMGEFMSEGRYYKLDMTIEELIDVLRTAGGDDIIRKKRAP